MSGAHQVVDAPVPQGVRAAPTVNGEKSKIPRRRPAVAQQSADTVVTTRGVAEERPKLGEALKSGEPTRVNESKPKAPCEECTGGCPGCVREFGAKVTREAELVVRIGRAGASADSFGSFLSHRDFSPTPSADSSRSALQSFADQVHSAGNLERKAPSSDVHSGPVRNSASESRVASRSEENLGQKNILRDAGGSIDDEDDHKRRKSSTEADGKTRRFEVKEAREERVGRFHADLLSTVEVRGSNVRLEPNSRDAALGRAAALETTVQHTTSLATDLTSRAALDLDRAISRLDRAVTRQIESGVDRPLRQSVVARLDAVAKAAVLPGIQAALDRHGIGAKVELLAKSGARATSGREVQMIVKLMSGELQRAATTRPAVRSTQSPLRGIGRSPGNPIPQVETVRGSHVTAVVTPAKTRKTDARVRNTEPSRVSRRVNVDTTRRVALRANHTNTRRGRPNGARQPQMHPQRTLSRLSTRPGVSFRDMGKLLARVSRRLSPDRMREIMKRIAALAPRRSTDRTALGRRVANRQGRTGSMDKATRRALLMRFRETLRRRDERRLRLRGKEDRGKDRGSRRDRERRAALRSKEHKLSEDVRRMRRKADRQRDVTTNQPLTAHSMRREKRRGDREIDFALSPVEMRILEKLIKKLGQRSSIDEAMRQVRKQRKSVGKGVGLATTKKKSGTQGTTSQAGPEGAPEKVTFDGATAGSKTLDLNTAKTG